MPIRKDFELVRFSDGSFVHEMQPPTAVGGWDIRFEIPRIPGNLSGFAVKSVASGHNGVSGITVLESGEGRLQITLNSQDTSGRDPGNYWYTIDRLLSGARSRLTEGYITLLP